MSLSQKNCTETDSGPELNPSIQAMINCGADTAGSCSGGSALGAWTWAKDAGGVPLDTCLAYAAVNGVCDPSNTCRNCMGKVAEPKGPEDYFCYGVSDRLSEGGEKQSVPCFGDDCVTSPYPKIKVRDMGVVCNATYDADPEVHKANAVMMQVRKRGVPARRGRGARSSHSLLPSPFPPSVF